MDDPEGEPANVYLAFGNDVFSLKIGLLYWPRVIGSGRSGLTAGKDAWQTRHLNSGVTGQ